MVCAAANLLADRGYDVHVVYSIRPETPAGISGMFRSSVTLHVIPMSINRAPVALIALRRLLRELNPGLVHLHSSIAGFLGRLASFGLPGQTKFFYSPHCIAVMRRDIRAKRLLYALLERVANIRACSYLACSQSERAAIRQWVGADALVLENAVEPFDLPVPRREGASNRGARIVTVGGVRSQKGPKMFAAIAEACAGRALDVQFTWVGDGDASSVDSLRAAGVEVTGWVPRLGIGGLLADSDIYLSTAEWEGLPVSVIEAMAAGVLVVGSSCAGNIDAIEHGRTGLLFSSVDEAVDLLDGVLSNRFDLAMIKKNALEETRARFSMDNFAMRILSIYGLDAPASHGGG